MSIAKRPYEAPRVLRLSHRSSAAGETNCSGYGSGADSMCQTGATAGDLCLANGSSAGGQCSSTGFTPGYWCTTGNTPST
jgi:hypothetical protein